MKKILFLFLSVIFLSAFSCQQNVNKSISNCCLTAEDSISIIKEIMETTDAYAEANNKIDADKCGEFYDSSSDFMFAETGKEYPTWDSIYSDIKNWYSQPLDSVQMIWEDRNINPLNHNAATLYSTFLFKAKFTSGEVYKSRCSLTGLMTKKSGKWKMTQGYCSMKVITN